MPTALVQEDPIARTNQVAADWIVQADERCGEAAEGHRETNSEERHESQPEYGEVNAHHVGRVFGPTKASLVQGKSGLHEDRKAARTRRRGGSYPA